LDRIHDAPFLSATSTAGILVLAAVTVVLPAGQISLDLPPTSTVEDWITSASREVDEVVQLAPNWDGRGGITPTIKAAELARSVLLRMHSVGVRYERIVAIPDGGVSIYMVSAARIPGGAHRRYVRITCDNDGDVLLLRCDRVRETLDTESLSTDDAALDRSLEGAREFLG
jgi:hypothetical protein